MLEIQNVSKTFNAGTVNQKTALNGLNLKLNEGDFVTVIGGNGAGKSTMLNAVAGVWPVDEGKIIIDGVDVTRLSEHQRAAYIGRVFQDPMTALNPLQRVGEQIAEVISLHRDQSKEETEKTVDEIMKSVGLPPDRKDEYPHQFSGGMKQRIVIAIALACNPSLLIADEPTTALDVTIQAQILHMIEELKRERNTSMILITHDLGIVVEMCSKVAIMYAGEIVESGTVEDIYGARQHPYTIGLFDSVPNLEDEQERLTPINGLMPDPVNLPKGCKFHPRCPYATERCKKEQPANVEVSSGHFVQCHMAKVAEKEE